MAYSKKLETYVSLDDLAKSFEFRCFKDGLDAMEGTIWHRIKGRYPKAKQDRWDEIYYELRDQLLSEYDIKVSVKVERKEGGKYLPE